MRKMNANAEEIEKSEEYEEYDEDEDESTALARYIKEIIEKKQKGITFDEIFEYIEKNANIISKSDDSTIALLEYCGDYIVRYKSGKLEYYYVTDDYFGARDEFENLIHEKDKMNNNEKYVQSDKSKYKYFRSELYIALEHFVENERDFADLYPLSLLDAIRYEAKTLAYVYCSDIALAQMDDYYIVHNLAATDAGCSFCIITNCEKIAREIFEPCVVECIALQIDDFIKEHDHTDTFKITSLDEEDEDGDGYYAYTIQCTKCGEKEDIDVTDKKYKDLLVDALKWSFSEIIKSIQSVTITTKRKRSYDC